MSNASLPSAVPDSKAATGVARRYVPEFDGLRAIAVLLVILYHSRPDGFFEGGFLGCDLFFVLSAFLITSILVEEQQETGTIRLKEFYWRRTLRLMPALMLFLTTYVAVAPLIWPGYPHLRDAVIAGLYVSNLAVVAAHLPALITHTWSLAAEEQFYLLWPVTLIFLLRSKRPVIILGALWVALTALRFVTDDLATRYYGFATHGTGLVFGAMLYFLIRDGKLAFRPFHAVAAVAILALLSVEAQIGAPEMPITVTEFVAAILIGTIVTNPAPLRLLAARPLVGLGKLSYGLYLWHYAIARVFREIGGFWSTFTITFALSLGLAWLSYVTVESWARRLRGPHKLTGSSTVEAAA